jgi:hypothetical protein
MDETRPEEPGGWLPSSRYDAFISYSRKDSAWVAKLRDGLEAAGKDVWMDRHDIPKGEDWAQQIERGIQLADNFVFVLSPDSLESPEVGKEVAHALRSKKRLLPVLARDVDRGAAPPEVRRINFVIPDERGVDGVIEEVARAIDTDLEHVQDHTMLLARSLEWEESERNGGFLIKGEQLTAAERWLAEAPAHGDPQPTALQAEFLLASREAVTRFTRIVFGSVACGLAVALALTGAFLVQRTQRLNALRADNLSLNAGELAPRDPTLAFELTRRALDADASNARSQGLIRSLFHESPERPFYEVLEPDSDAHAAALAAFGADPFTRYGVPLPSPKRSLFATRATWDGRYVVGWSALEVEDGEAGGQENRLEVQDPDGRVVLRTVGRFPLRSTTATADSSPRWGSMLSARAPGPSRSGSGAWSS